jgi:uroporphyrinogen III methyltransferase/synthase
MSKVYLIGAGPGDPGLFTLRGRELLSSCDVVVYDHLASPTLLALARHDAEIIYAGKQGGDHTLPQKRINELLVQKARQGKSVARLKGGDPYMFGRGAEEAEELLAAGVAFEVVPGVSSAIAAAAYAGIPLTHRAYASSVCFATGHEDPGKPEERRNWAALAKSAGTLVFFMGMKNLPEISRKLIDNGMHRDTSAALICWGTTPEHRSCVSTLAKLPEDAAQHGFTAPSLIVIGDVVKLRDSLNWFEHKPLLGKGVVVTRNREQASGIAALLAEQGARVLEFPMIRIEPLPDYAPLRQALCCLSRYDWIIFSSVNGVAFFRRELEALRLDARALAGLQVAAIGPATAKALAGLGIAPDFVPDASVAESALAGLLRLGVKGRRVLIPRAREARDVLPEGLEEAGAAVDVIPVYATVPSGEGRDEMLGLLEKGAVQAVTFASSSTVRNFLQLVPAETLHRHPELRFACIGPVTARTLEDAGLVCHIQPREFTVPAMVDAVAAYFRTRK